MRETQSQNETIQALRELFSIRSQYMERKRIPAWSSNGEKTVLNDAQRMEVLSQWKEEYHSRPDQIERQKRDSWLIAKERSKGGKGSDASFWKGLQREDVCKSGIRTVGCGGRLSV